MKHNPKFNRCPQCFSCIYDEYVCSAAKNNTPVMCYNCGHKPDSTPELEAELNLYRTEIHQARVKNWKPDQYDNLIGLLRSYNIDFMTGQFPDQYERFIRLLGGKPFIFIFNEYGQIQKVKEDRQSQPEL